MLRLFSIFSRAGDLVYPAKCVSCGEPIDRRGEVFCDACLSSYENAKQDICSRCLKPRCLCTCPSFGLGKAGLRRLIKLFKYQPNEGDLPENRVLYALKQRHIQSVFDFLARDLAYSIGEALTVKERQSAVLVPCPRSAAAKRKNGYDHAFELCRSLARETGIPVSFALHRRRGGKMQKRLTGEERRRNIENSFAVVKPDEITGKTVLLIDDVTTSGATLLECRRVLKIAGASRVIPAVLAVSGRDFVLRPRKKRKKGKRYRKKKPTARQNAGQSV